MSTTTAPMLAVAVIVAIGVIGFVLGRRREHRHVEPFGPVVTRVTDPYGFTRAQITRSLLLHLDNTEWTYTALNNAALVSLRGSTVPEHLTGICGPLEIASSSVGKTAQDMVETWLYEGQSAWKENTPMLGVQRDAYSWYMTFIDWDQVGWTFVSGVIENEAFLVANEVQS